MNFDCIYIIGISIPTAKLLGLLELEMFFETRNVRYYCGIIQYMFLFVSVSVNMSLSLPYKIQNVTPVLHVVVSYNENFN